MEPFNRKSFDYSWMEHPKHILHLIFDYAFKWPTKKTLRQVQTFSGVLDIEQHHGIRKGLEPHEWELWVKERNIFKPPNFDGIMAASQLGWLWIKADKSEKDTEVVHELCQKILCCSLSDFDTYRKYSPFVAITTATKIQVYLKSVEERERRNRFRRRRRTKVNGQLVYQYY